MRDQIATIILLLLSPVVATKCCFADTRSSCSECVIEADGPAALSKEVILRALPALSDLTKVCPSARKESTMFLSPFRVESEGFYDLQLRFIFGGDSQLIAPLSTLYTSYFMYDTNPGEPLLMVTYLAMRNQAWAKQLQNGFTTQPPDKLFATSAGRYFVLLRRTAHAQSANCLLAAKGLFEQQLHATAEQIGPEEPSGGALEGVLFAQGAIVDTLTTLTEEQLSALRAKPDTIYALAAQQGLSKGGSSLIAEFRNLEILSLGPVQLAAQDMEAIGSLKKLRILKLGSDGISDQMLIPLGNLRTLQSVSLRKNPITSAGVQSLLPLKSLIYLALASTNISDAALDTVAQLTALQSLFLHNTPVTDAGVAKLQSLTQLNYLTLNGTKITDATIDVLAKLPALRQVYLGETSVTEEGRNKLKRIGAGRIRVE